MFRHVDLNRALIISFNANTCITEQKTRLGKQLSLFLLILQKKQYRDHSQTLCYSAHNESSDKSKKTAVLLLTSFFKNATSSSWWKEFNKTALANTAHYDFQTYSTLYGFGARNARLTLEQRTKDLNSQLTLVFRSPSTLQRPNFEPPPALGLKSWPDT